MNKITFIYIASFFLILALFSGVTEYNTPFQVAASVVFIALLGIPHGAIDHVLFMENTSFGPFRFYAFYLGMIALYVIFWLIFPAFSMAVFLFLSAYHFGQSQFTEIKAIPFGLRPPLYFFWGTSILSALIFYNADEIRSLAKSMEGMEQFIPVFNPSIHLILVLVASIFVVASLIYCLVTKKLKSQRFFIEILTLVYIHFSFYVLPILVAFTLYFTILHSLKVLSEEYSFLQKRKPNFNIKKFVKMLLPFTILSLAGSALIIFLAEGGYIPASNLLLVFILISVLTLPHSIVMERFYRVKN